MSDYRVERGAGAGMSTEAMRAQLETEGYETYEWGDAPGALYPFHEHGTEQSHWIISGSIELNVEGHGTFVLEAGDRDLMPAGTRHSARVTGRSPVRYLIGRKSAFRPQT
jgi:mannose-6-phosphate isomerase-like protein (cupin superfamily)